MIRIETVADRKLLIHSENLSLKSDQLRELAEQNNEFVSQFSAQRKLKTFNCFLKGYNLSSSKFKTGTLDKHII